MEAYQELQGWWSITGVDIKTEAVSDDQIHGLENRYGVKLPADFRAYLANFCPAEDNWDEEMGNWWPFARIKNVPEEYPYEPIPHNASKYLFFLDHCIWCWAWAISCADDDTFGSVVAIGGSEQVVAKSFSEFVTRYINDWITVT